MSLRTACGFRRPYATFCRGENRFTCFWFSLENRPTVGPVLPPSIAFGVVALGPIRPHEVLVYVYVGHFGRTVIQALSYVLYVFALLE